MRRATTRIACLTMLVLASLTVIAPPTLAADSPSLFGIVTDAATGEPVPGACLSVRSNIALDWEMARTCTGADGGYRIDGLTVPQVPSPMVRVQVLADGFAPQWAPDGPSYRNAQTLSLSTTTPTELNLALHAQFGTVRGHLTTPEGGPAALATVFLKSTTTTWNANISTGVDGLFSLTGVPAGDYTARLSHPQLRLQWFDGKTGAAAADVFSVPSGGEVVVDDQFLVRTAPAVAGGTMQGTITDRVNGAPVGGARVTLLNLSFERAGEMVSESSGQVSIAGVPPTMTFVAEVTAAGYAPYWVGDSPTINSARRLTLSSGARLDSALRRGAGTLRGQVTDPAGAPISADIFLSLPGRTNELLYRSRVDGSFEFTGLPADAYGARFVSPSLGSQAESFTIVDVQVTTHNVRHKPRGTLRVRLVDSERRAPVPDVCVSPGLAVWPGGGSSCSDASGVVTIAGVAPGTGEMQVTHDANPTVLNANGLKVTVRSGETTDITVTLRTAGMIQATVQRAPDGTVPLVCVRPIPVALAAPIPTDNPPEGGICNNDAAGNHTQSITIGPVATGDMQLFVETDLTQFGVQWLGSAGGTGDRRKAAIIQVRRGQTTTAPLIKLDRPGSISGMITDRVTGFPLIAAATPFGRTMGMSFSVGCLPVSFIGCSDSTGRYTISGLGPYAWPIHFLALDHAQQWSGGAAHRFDATLIPVSVGQTTTLNAVLGPEGRINIRAGGTDLIGWFATAYNAVTGDVVGGAVYHNPPVIGLLNTESVFIQYFAHVNGQPQPACWYGIPRRGFTPARYTIAVTAGQTVDGVDLIPGETCGGLPRLPRPRIGGAFIDDATAPFAPAALIGGNRLPTWAHGPAWPTVVRLVQLLARQAKQA